jgi:hypothetical protein
MTLLNAPVYNEHRENLKKGLLVGAGVLLALVFVVTFAGFLLGHGWAFTNLPAEHRVSTFFDALEAKDYPKAFAIWNNDDHWQEHPQKYKDYPLARFTEDWTTYSPVKGPITSHKIDISKTDGLGTFGTGIIVACRLNGDHKAFMWYQKSDGTLTYPAPHELSGY